MEKATNAMAAQHLLTLDNPVFKCYAFYTCLLSIKIFLVALSTTIQRFRKKVFISVEDTKIIAGSEVREDPHVERIRRAHLNDLENIPVFFISGLLFVLVDPHVMLAKWTFRIYTLARYLHSIVYILAVPQPARAICYGFAIGINYFILAIVIFHCFSV